MWLEIAQNRPFFDGYNPSAGRFYPLAFIDLAALMQLSASPYLFFSFNALIVLAIGILLYILLDSAFLDSTSHLNKPPKYHHPLYLLTLTLILFHPGFVTIMIGICYPERLQILFLLIFVLASASFYKTQNLKTALIGIIAANLSLYYKEPTFLIVGFFGVFHLFFLYLTRHNAKSKAIKTAHKKLAIYYATLCLSALIFIALYMILIYPNITNAYRREIFLSTYEMVLYIAKGIINFGLNDCFLLIALPALAIYRFYAIAFKKDFTHLFWDSLIFSGLLYVCAFLALRLFEAYYLMPAYIISIGGIIYFLFHAPKMHKLILGFCLLLFSINTLPQGIYTYIWLKTEGVKFHESLSFVANLAKNSDKPLTLYFDGNGRGEEYNTWYWGFFDKYLQEIYGVKNFDIKTNMPNSKTLYDKPKLWLYDPNFPLTIYNSPDITTPKSGDLIILNSSTKHNANKAYLENLRQTHDEIFVSKAFGIPYFGLKPLIKTLFSKSQALQDATLNNKNVFKFPTHDHIYKVR